MTKPRRPLMAALRSSTRDVYTTAYIHLVLRCRGKSNNFTLGELAIARFRLVCLSRIARITRSPRWEQRATWASEDVEKSGIQLFGITGAYRVPSVLIDIFINKREISFLSFLLLSVAIQFQLRCEFCCTLHLFFYFALPSYIDLQLL